MFFGTIGGGSSNTLQNGWASFIGGGTGNRITGTSSVIAGGTNNIVGDYDFGSPDSSVYGDYALIAGGANNRVLSHFSTIMGGSANLVAANADHGLVLGGSSNVVEGSFALSAGKRAMALHDGAFVWGDSNNENVESSAENEFTARASGGVRFFSSADLSTGVTLAPGDGSWASVSDRNAKQAFQPVNGTEILEKVAALPLSTWSYRTQDSSIRHIGPMAQDFHAAFGFGTDDKRITSVDADGVALAAIQGLNQKLSQKDSEITDLKQRVAALENLIKQLSLTHQ
jgi:hypothetical protein